MDITERFKKDFGNYFLGVIIPSSINAITVPLFKRMLGPAVFGVYGIRYNLMLLVVAFTAGWLYQSIVRLKFSAAAEETSFIKTILKFCSSIILVASSISFIFSLYYFKASVGFSLFFASCVLMCGMQNVFIAISQANFLSRYIMLTEAIRTSSFFLLSIVLLKAKLAEPIYALFTALLCSYTISAVLLARKNKIYSVINTVVEGSINFKIRPILNYGMPLAAWYLISNLIFFLDKPLIAKTLGNEIQGHYQALYEIINKGAVVLLIPVLYALFPLLSNAFEKEDHQAGMKFLKKIILIEVMLLVAGLLVYWIFGFQILRFVLSIPNTFNYKITGLIMLASVLVWQIGMLVQKPFELRMQTGILLKVIIISMFVFILIFWWVKNLSAPEVYQFTFPFLGASLSYVSGCGILLRRFRRNNANFSM